MKYQWREIGEGDFEDCPKGWFECCNKSPVHDTRRVLDEDEIYCPICAKAIKAANAEDVTSGISDGYVFVHDDIKHDDSDIEALAGNLN